MTMALLGLEDDLALEQIATEVRDESLSILVRAGDRGTMDVATIFLPGEWADSELQVDEEDGHQVLIIRAPHEELVLPLAR